MHRLIVYAHPNPKSFCNAIKEAVYSEFISKGDKVTVRDLYGIGFDPVLKGSDLEALHAGSIPSDIKQEQSYLKEAEVFTFIYPIWWTGQPALLKGYFDRVFSHGFAYAIDENHNIQQLLKGKKAIIFNTMGTPEDIYEQSGMKKAMLLTSDTGIFEFCGIEVIAHRFYGAVPFVDNAARAAMLQDIREVLKSK